LIKELFDTKESAMNILYKCVILFLVLLIQTPILAQDSLAVLVLSPRVGSVIDVRERNLFHLFSTISDFRSAVFVRSTDGVYALIEREQRPDTTLMFNWTLLSMLSQKVDYFEDISTGRYQIIPNPEQENDPRNLQYDELVFGTPSNIPESGDVEDKPVTFNQSHTSSCTCQGAAGVIYQMEKMLVSPRYAFNVIRHDSKYSSSGLTWGAYMADPFKLQVNEGICDFRLAPNDDVSSDSEFLRLNVTEEMQRNADKNKGGAYAFLANTGTDLDKFDSVVRFLALERRPVCVAVKWHKGFNNARKTGIVPAKPDSSNAVGHVMMAVAWKKIDGHEYIGFRNSWGEGWGDNGRVWLPKGFVHIYSAMGYLPPKRFEEIRIETPVKKSKKGVVRNLHKERANAMDLRRWIHEVKFADEGTPEQRASNQVARGIAAREWLKLVWAVSYLGWTHLDVLNYLYAKSRGKEDEEAYNLDFTISRETFFKK